MAAKEMKERKGEATTIKLHTDMTVLVETLDKEKADPAPVALEPGDNLDIEVGQYIAAGLKIRTIQFNKGD